MIAEAKSLRFLGEGKKLTVPFFQRTYVWDEDNWEELLNSFDNIDTKPFLGSMILKNITKVLGPEEKMIIDGQQRLTTITILAKALYDSLPQSAKGSDSGIEADLKSFLFYKNNASDAFYASHVKIEHSRLDNAAYETVITAGLFPGKDAIDCNTINENSSRIYQCYKYYMDALKNHSVDKLNALHDAMFSKERKVFVLIELEQNDINEQSIFDTINRAGIRLSTADIIKNNLFKLCLDRCGEVDETEEDVWKLYEKNWNQLFYADEDSRRCWDDKRIFGNVERTNLEFLLYCVATIEWEKEKDIFSQMDKVYSDKIEAYSYKQLTDLVEEIYSYGKLFKTWIIDFKANLSSPETMPHFKHTGYVPRLLLILERFGVQMFYPYVLKRMADVDCNFEDETLAHDFGVLESFVVRRRLSGRGVTDYTIKCNQMLHEENGLQTALIAELVSVDSSINDRAFVSHAAYIKNTEVAKILLFCIELYRRNNPKYDVNALQYSYTLEHIMPQKWDTNWSSIPVYSEDGTVFTGSDEDRRSIRSAAVHSLGNMILLKDKLNTSVSNNCFELKVKGNGKHKGYQEYATLLLAREIVDEYANGQSEWDEKRIHDRLQALMKDALIIWPNFASEFPQTHYDEENEREVAEEDSLSVDDFTDEAFQDPLRLIDEMESLTSGGPTSAVPSDTGQDVSGMLSQDEFIRKVSIHSETVLRYIREGKIVPDAIISVSENRTKKYYFPQSVIRYAQEFGWELIDENDLLPAFISMVEKMTMSYSYKPIFVDAVLSKANLEGKVGLGDIICSFREFYNLRRSACLVIEKPDSVFSKEEYSDDEARKTILRYPYARFAEMGMMSYDAANEEICIHKVIWNGLDFAEKARLCSICHQKLDEYYSRF